MVGGLLVNVDELLLDFRRNSLNIAAYTAILVIPTFLTGIAGTNMQNTNEPFVPVSRYTGTSTAGTSKTHAKSGTPAP